MSTTEIKVPREDNRFDNPKIAPKRKSMLSEKKQQKLSRELKCSNEFSVDRPWSVFGEKLVDDKMHKFTHVSLFSGCGGFDLGFRQAGFKTIFANDLNSDACQTYRHNIGEIVEGNLLNIEIPKFKKRPDLLSAGFPCQPFSNAGSRRGIEDDRGTLFQTTIDIVEKMKPRAIVFENVRGLLSFKKDDKLLIEEICSQLDNLGYDVVFSLVDTSRHNVAQKRLRLVIVGIERAKSHGRFAFPSPVDREDLSLKHTILDLPKDAINQDELMQLNPQAIHIGSMIPEGGSWKSIPYDKLPPRLQRVWDNIERYRWPTFYRRFHRDEVAGTITAAFKPENAGVWHPTERRIFSVREIGRIQSFPDWFSFEGKNIKSKYQQIGNAVPPRLAFELGKQILEVLKGKDQRAGKSELTFAQFINAGKPLKAKDHDVIFSKGQNNRY
ncbi:MAG TPA: DNA cytosine methyltransferase [Flavobacterium sp.]|jgi:DNA (cytosine-5)-methyltransferase 1